MKLPLFPMVLAAALAGCGRDGSGRSGGKAEAENGRPFRGVGHGTGEPGSGYGGQAGGKATENPSSDTTGSPRGPDRATRPGTGNAEAR